jgi:hypothetical protein
MTDTMSYVSNISNGACAHHPSNGGEADSRAGFDTNRFPSAIARDSPGRYLALSPKGIHIPIPKELFVALSDFIATRKYPGSITIQFRSGEITCVESMAKKTYRNNV